MRNIMLCISIVILLLFAPLVTVSHAADVTLAWDANPEVDLAGYRLYQAEKIGDTSTAWEAVVEIPAGTETCVVTIDETKDFAWLLTAFDTAGYESFVSNLVEVVKPVDCTPPGRAKNLRKN